MLEKHGYKVVDETEYNWYLADDSSEPPIMIPKKGSVVAIPVMSNVMGRARKPGVQQTLLDAVREYTAKRAAGLAPEEDDEEQDESP